jgi:SAM-dependent methyltransferase
MPDAAVVTGPPAQQQVPILSIVMPCFNEETTVERALRRVLEQPFVAEVVVVDDGSSDGTVEVLKRITDDRVRVVRHRVNRGKGAALRTGFGLVSAPFVAVQDADLEYDPAELADLLVPLLEGDADVVFGSRFLTTEARRVLYFWHSLGNKLLTLYSNMATNLNLTDMETCYKVFRREVLAQIVIEEDRFGVEPELTAKIAALGCRTYEIGISYHGRSYAEGKKTGWKDGVRAVWSVSKFSLLARRSRRRREHPPNEFSAADQWLEVSLSSLEDAEHYTDWLVSLVEPHAHGHVLEVGAGHGHYTGRIAEMATDVVACEPSERAAEILEGRFAGRSDIRVVCADVAGALDYGPFDTAVMLNVLEHVEDDDKVLQQLRDALHPGGRLVLFVPAFELLYSRYDHAIGHYRRYRRSELEAKASQAGFSIVASHYVNATGFLAWLLSARVLGLTPTQNRLVVAYDRFAVPGLRRVESHITPPFGQSLLVVAERV